MAKSQIGNLTPGPSFGHNLCFKYPNDSCKPILDISISRSFQWYKEFFNPMSFDPYNHSLKIWKSIGTPTPKVGVHLGVWRFIPSLSYTPKSMKCDSWASVLASTFVGPCFDRKPKDKVATINVSNYLPIWLKLKICILLHANFFI
jgi:hypothetical protein